MVSTNTLTFNVTRKSPELVPPADLTPHEFKHLSDLDIKNAIRFQVPNIHFYKKNPLMDGKDPVTTIRDAISKALVFYYPLAGRVRECAGRKLAVECTGEGIVFVEADADVMLQQFGDTLYPPFPHLDELLHDVPGSCELINSPLLTVQVTRLTCGGFILAYRINHIICDGAGIVQFMFAVGELARGAAFPSIPPVWERHLLTAPRPSSEPNSNVGIRTPIPLDKMVLRNFFFGADDISALCRSLPPHLQSCSRFLVVAACAWRCWAMAVASKPDEDIVFIGAMDIRKQMKPPLPVGYYGNAIVPLVAVTTANELSKHPLHYAVELLKKGKHEVTDEYIARQLAIEVYLVFKGARVYVVSDLTLVHFKLVDFGWGTAAYGGVAKGVADWTPAMNSWYIPFTDGKGEPGTMVPVYLPPNAMEVFVKQLELTMAAARASSHLKVSAL